MEKNSVDKKTNHTSKELQKWMENCSDDPSFREQAQFVEDKVTEWREGDATAVDTHRKIYQQYFETDGSASEAASAMLIQSADLWFAFEADLPHEVCWANYELERDRSRVEKGAI